jgi:hypothetical protein
MLTAVLLMAANRRGEHVSGTKEIRTKHGDCSPSTSHSLRGEWAEGLMFRGLATEPCFSFLWAINEEYFLMVVKQNHSDFMAFLFTSLPIPVVVCRCLETIFHGGNMQALLSIRAKPEFIEVRKVIAEIIDY